MNFNDNELNRMSRRRFLRTATAMGVSASALAYGTQDGLVAAADENEVPYVRYVNNYPGDRESEPVYASIHRDEWEVRHTADDAAEKIGHQIEDQGWETGLVAPGWGADEDTPNGFGVHVEYRTVVHADGSVSEPAPSYDEVRRKLPNTINGEVSDGNGGTHSRQVPVKVERVRDEKTIQTSGNPADPDTPGGYKVESASGDYFTLCATFDSDYNGLGSITTGHATDLNENVICQGDVIGDVEDRNNGIDIDWAFVDDDGENHVSQLTDGDGSQMLEQVSGIVSDSAMKNDAGTSETYYTQGKVTERTACTVIGVNGFGSSWVKVSSDVQDGDSGGPVFNVSGSDAYIGGVIVSNVSGDCKATTAETVQNKALGKFY